MKNEQISNLKGVSEQQEDQVYYLPKLARESKSQSSLKKG